MVIEWLVFPFPELSELSTSFFLVDRQPRREEELKAGIACEEPYWQIVVVSNPEIDVHLKICHVPKEEDNHKLISLRL